MIYANEAHKISEKNNTIKNALAKIVEGTMPFFEENIRHIASMGGDQMIIRRDEIMEHVSYVLFTKKEILDAIVVELRSYGYKANATPSYSSLHIEWSGKVED